MFANLKYTLKPYGISMDMKRWKWRQLLAYLALAVIIILSVTIPEKPFMEKSSAKFAYNSNALTQMSSNFNSKSNSGLCGSLGAGSCSQ